MKIHREFTRPSDDGKDVRVRKRLSREDDVAGAKVLDDLPDIVGAPDNRQAGKFLADAFPVDIYETEHIVSVAHAASQSAQQFLCRLVCSNDKRFPAQDASPPFRCAFAREPEGEPPEREKEGAQHSGDDCHATAETVVFEEEYQRRDDDKTHGSPDDRPRNRHSSVRVNAGEVEAHHNDERRHREHNGIGLLRKAGNASEPDQLGNEQREVYQQDIDDRHPEGADKRLDHRQPRRDTDGGTDKKREHSRAAQMLPDEQMHGVIERPNLVQVASLCALSFVMNDLCRVHVIVLPPRLLNAVTPIEVLAVHEEIFVQSTHLFVRFPPHHHERTAYRVKFVRFVRVEIRQVVFSEEPGTREEGTQTRHLGERRPRPRETPPAGKLKRSVGIEDFAAREADVRILGEELQHHAEGIFLHDRVGVDEKEEFPAGAFQPEVVGPGKAQIALVGDEMYRCEPAADHFDAAVIGGIIHNDDFASYPLRRFPQRYESMMQKVPHVVVDDDNGEKRGGIWGSCCQGKISRKVAKSQRKSKRRARLPAIHSQRVKFPASEVPPQN